MILVTGGSGFLGISLIKRLLDMGREVRALDMVRSSELPDEVKFYEGDIRNYELVKEASEGCELVFHLVGIMPQARADRETMRSINVGGTENVLRSAGECGVTRVVFLSSSEVYGHLERVPIKEGDRKAPIGEYGHNKVEAEGLCLEYSQRHGFEVVILRPSTIVGPGITERLFLRFLSMSLKGRPLIYLGKGKNRFQMTALSDTVDACILAATKEGISGEAFNLGAENTLNMKDQIEELITQMGIKSKIISIPAWLARAFLTLIYPFGLSPLEPDHFKLADEDFVLDCTKARDMLGWVPKKTNIDMIVETIKWFKVQGSKFKFKR